jgi:hypothetical protein
LTWINVSWQCAPQIAGMRKINMSLLRTGSTLVVLAATIVCGEALAQAPTPSANPAPAASSEVAKPGVSSRIKSWTRSQWAAQKKRWAEDRDRFADCQVQLRERARPTRLSPHQQKHFLYSCMSKAR